MKNCIVLSVISFALLVGEFLFNEIQSTNNPISIQAVLGEACQDIPTTNCDTLCFCPCRPPGGGKTDVIKPSPECLALIDCISTTLECSAEVMACQKPKPETELCFCPCRIPFCGPDVLYYPSQSCLQRIKCAFGQSECSAEYIYGKAN